MNDQTDREVWLAWLLRLAGSFEILAFVAVVMPRSWMEISHSWLGLGVMPEGSVLMFLIRQASYCYGMHGISLWLLASDVKRFRPLIMLNGLSFLLAGPIFFVIDYTAGMPMWWTLGDGGSCGLLGLAILLLGRERGNGE